MYRELYYLRVKRWQEYTEELYKKDLHDPDNHDTIIHLEPDILECKVKTKLVEVMEFQLSYFKSCAALHMLANLENSSVATDLEKVSFHSSPKEGQCQRMFKLLYICAHLTC